MSWTQVYVSGLHRSKEPSDEEIEVLLAARYNLASSDEVVWAGAGTTLIKRDEMGSCRGFAFLTFYSVDGASIAVDRINSGYLPEGEDEKNNLQLPILRAELSNARAGKDRKKTKDRHKQESSSDSDLRLRRRRKAPIRKHPVIVSSDGKRTNLGNKTR